MAAAKEYYALTAAQNRLYILQQLDSESTAYNMSMLLPLNGKHEYARVLDVLQHIIKRHDSLRTSFEMMEHGPVQKIHSEITFSLPQYECIASELPQVYAGFPKPFHLHRAPLLRAAYVNVTDGQDYLLVDMHHIITEGVSQSILEREFHALYKGEELPPLALQYKDFSEWLNSAEQQSRITEQAGG